MKRVETAPMTQGRKRNPVFSEVPVERRLAHVPNAFTGAVAIMVDPMQARQMAEQSLRVATHCQEKAIRSFLSSPYGGAFGVDVAQRIAAGDTLRAAMTTVIREWMERRPSSAEVEALDVKPSVPYLSAVVTAAGIAQN